jgi:hypothetical protein
MSGLFNNDNDRFGGHTSLDAGPPLGWVNLVFDRYGKEIPQAMPKDHDLYKDDSSMDIHLISKDGVLFKCHGCILAARSQYFRTLLTTNVGRPYSAYSKDRPLELHCPFSSIVLQAVKDHIYVGLPQFLGLDGTHDLSVSAAADVTFALPAIYKASQYYALPKLSELLWHAMKQYGEAEPWNNFVMLQSCMHHDVREGKIEGFLLCNIVSFWNWNGYLRDTRIKPPHEILSYIGADCIEHIVTHDSLNRVSDLYKFIMLEIWASSRTVASAEDFGKAMAMVEVHIALENIPKEFFISQKLNYSGIASAEQMEMAFQMMDDSSDKEEE